MNNAVQNFIEANQMAKQLDKDGTSWYCFRADCMEDVFCISGLKTLNVYHWGFCDGVLVQMEICEMGSRDFYELMGERFINSELCIKEQHKAN